MSASRTGAMCGSVFTLYFLSQRDTVKKQLHSFGDLGLSEIQLCGALTPCVVRFIGLCSLSVQIL